MMSNREIGSIVECRVVDIVPFGAFVKIKGGGNGLIHISQISEKFVRDVRDFLSVGDDVVAKVAQIDQKGRVQLSMREVKPEELDAMQKTMMEAAAAREKKERPQERAEPREESFEAKMKNFMRQSEDRLVDIKRHNESKLGGGQRRKK